MVGGGQLLVAGFKPHHAGLCGGQVGGGGVQGPVIFFEGRPQWCWGGGRGVMFCEKKTQGGRGIRV